MGGGLELVFVFDIANGVEVCAMVFELDVGDRGRWWWTLWGVV